MDVFLRHNQLFHPIGRLAAFFSSSEHEFEDMHDVYIVIGAHSLRAGWSILLGPGVLIVVAVAHLTRELLVDLNEADHRGQKFGVGDG